MIAYNILLMRKIKIPTEFLTMQGSLVHSLESIIDYFLDDATKQIIRKYDFEELGLNDPENQRFEVRIRIVGIKVFILYQNCIKHFHAFKMKTAQLQTKYIQLPVSALYRTVKQHPISVFIKDTVASAFLFCKKELEVVIRLTQQYVYVGARKIKECRLRTHAQEAARRLKKVVEAGFCYTRQTRMYKRSKQLYSFVQDKYSELRRKFSNIKKQTELLSQKIASENSCQSFIFPESYQQKRQRLLRVRSNQNIKKNPFRSRASSNKLFQIPDQEESSLENGYRKQSMSQYGGYSSDSSI